MPNTRSDDSERLDLLLRRLAQEAGHCDRTARAAHCRAEQLGHGLSRGLAGHALGYAQANEAFARRLRELVATKGAVKC
jgi:hypothetical protein